MIQNDFISTKIFWAFRGEFNCDKTCVCVRSSKELAIHLRKKNFMNE